MKDKKEKIIYTKGDDEIADLSNQVDFSQGFKNRKIAEALCNENPHEERVLKSYVELVTGQKKRRENYLRVKQKNFFVTQVFEKNLNPYLESTEAGSSSEMKMDGREKSDLLESQEKFNKLYKQKQEEADEVSVRGGFVRSRTIGALRSDDQQSHLHTSISEVGRRSFDSRATTEPKLKFSAEKGDSFLSHHYSRLYLKSPGSKGSRSPRSKPSSPSKEVLDQIEIPAAPCKKDISTFRKNPHMLFPKLKGLITTPSLGDVTGSASNKRREIKRRENNSRKHHRKLPMVTIQESYGEGDNMDINQGAGDMMKMITQISTDLPEHLKLTARDQIRKMTKSDKIYEQKERLKTENRPYLDRERSFSDKRWVKLEKSLTPTVGVKTGWRQLYRAGPWVYQNNYKFF